MILYCAVEDTPFDMFLVDLRDALCSSESLTISFLFSFFALSFSAVGYFVMVSLFSRFSGFFNF